MLRFKKKVLGILSGIVLVVGLAAATPMSRVLADTTSSATQWSYEEINQQLNGSFIDTITVFSGYDRTDPTTYTTISNTNSNLATTPTVLNTNKIMNWKLTEPIKLYDGNGKYMCTINIPVFLTNAPSHRSLYYSGVPLEIDGDTQLYDGKGNVYTGNAINAPFAYNDNGDIIGYIKEDYSEAVKAKLFKALNSGNIDLYKKITSVSAKYPQIKLFNSSDNYKSDAELYGDK